MKLVYLEWEDAIAQAGWHTKEALERWTKEDCVVVKEVGWIYQETKKHIVLISRQSIDSPDGDIQYGLLQKIPKTWIRKRVDLTRHINDKSK